MFGKALVAAFLVLLTIIDESNQFQINNNAKPSKKPFGACEGLEMKYIGCMNWCMKRPTQMCPCGKLQHEFSACQLKRDGHVDPNMFNGNQIVNIPPQDDALKQQSDQEYPEKEKFKFNVHQNDEDYSNFVHKMILEGVKY